MTSYMREIYNCILIFALLINVISVRKLVKTTGFSEKEEWVLKLHMLGMAMAVLDWVCVWLRPMGLTALTYFLNVAFLYAYSMVGYIMAYYMLELYLERFAYNLKFKLAFSIPALVWFIFLAISCRYQWLYKMNERGFGPNGMWFWGSYIVFGNAYYYALMIQTVYRIIVTKLRKRDNTLPLVFSTPLIIGSTIQFMKPTVPGVNMGMAITFFIVCINNVEAIYKRQKKISRVLEKESRSVNADLQWHIDIQNILTKNAIYTYEFDVTTGIIPEDIVDKNGINYTKELGMKSPCRFDEIIPLSKADSFASSIEGLNSLSDLTTELMLEAYNSGITAIELECRYTTTGAYHRVTYMMSEDPLSGHIKALVTAHDVTILKQKEKLEIAEKERRSRELEAALEASDKAGKAKTAFLFNMSHDIRTPMNAIMGYTDLLDENIDNHDVAKDYVNKIKKASEFLLSIINNVLEMARIDYGKVALEEKPADINSLIELLSSVMSEDFKKKNIDFKIIVNVEHYYVYADNTKIREILLNLLSNALKYTNEGGHVTITITELAPKHNKMGCYQVVIEDDGIGISKEFIPTIFEEFSRERNSTESRIQGTGLGMSIVKKLLDLMGASIEIESDLGKGTRITTMGEFRLVENPISENVKNQEEKIENKYAGNRILLAEDNDMNAEIATVRLETEGFLVEHAKDGEIAFKMMQDNPAGYYDFILMDIQMPNMNGYEATKAIRQLDDEGKKNIKIFAVTANAFDEDRQNALDAGMNGHIAKPMKLEELMKMLDTSL